MFILVPLTIPFLIIYAMIRCWKVTLPVLGVTVMWFLVQLVPVVGVSILVFVGLVSLWVLRARLQDSTGKHSYVDLDA